jgi:hypothetical protein
MTTVNTLYGTFNEDDLKSIYSCLNEISNEMSIIDQHKEAIKDIMSAMNDAIIFQRKLFVDWLRRTTRIPFKKNLLKIMNLKHSIPD